MKRQIHFLLVVVMTVLIPTAMVAQQTEEGTATDGKVEVGLWDDSLEGSPDLVLEYQPDGGGPDVRFDLDSVQNWGYIGLDGKFRDSSDQDYDLDFDINRVWRSSNMLSVVLHRLGHQPLDHFEAATNHGRVTQHTDFSPDSVYEIDYQVFETWNEFQPKGIDNVTFGVGYRDQRREGLRQQTAVSHCDTCHVASLDRPVDEKTQDVTVNAKWAWLKGHITGWFRSRELSEGTQFIEYTYDNALHPELRLPLFDNRIQYDEQDGPQPIDLRPDTEKETWGIDGLYTLANGLTITGEGVFSKTQNKYSDLQSDYSGYLGTVAKRFGKEKSWNFRWRGRVYEIENDDVFVDTIEKVGIAGPQAGKTYREIYDFDPDFNRKSSLSRDVIESDLDLTCRFGRKGGNLRFFWDYEDIDRTNFEVAPGKTASTTNELGLSWFARPTKGVKTNLIFTYGDTSYPFNSVDDQYSTLVSSPAPSPFHPDAAQYYEFQDARIADGSALPASWLELEARATYTGQKATITGTYRYWDGDNDTGNLTDWARKTQAATVTLWSSPAPKWQWYAGWAYNDIQLDTTATVALFDG